MRMISSLFAVAALALLSACNTVSGLGEDVQSGGQTLTDTADQTASEM